MDEEAVAVVAATRQMVKSQLRSLRTLLTYLSELDKRLDAYSQEAERHEQSKVG